MSTYKGYKERMGVASMKYRKEKRSVIHLDVSKEEKDLWKRYADARGMTLSGYIKSLVKRDNE